MALPLKTIPDWVPNKINPRILFITENYPGDPNAFNSNTYFYRTLNPNITIKKANNLLNNLSASFNINGNNETEKLEAFLNVNNYFLIDTYPCGQAMSNQLINITLINKEWIDQILNDIVHINPEQIVFTCLGSNGRILPILSNRAKERNITILDRIISNTLLQKKVFYSPSNRAYPGFNLQIQNVIQQGIINI